MKKLLFIMLGGGIAINAGAQQMNHGNAAKSTSRIPFTSVSHAPRLASLHNYAARTTAAPFLTENFGTGGPGVMPTGWTTGAITVGTWKWTNTASTSSFTIGTLASTTASNGWMIFDSDSIGAATSGAPAGWLQSPSYDCSAHTTVRLSFQEKYRKFNDSCFVWVSTTPGFATGTYTSFPVMPNNGLAGNVSTSDPQNVYVNITSVAAGQSTVYIRFVTMGPSLGAYSWMIDDLGLSEMDPHDVSIGKSFLWNPDPNAYDGSMFVTPLAYVDTVFPVTQISNQGANAEASVSVTATISNGSPLYTQTEVVPALPINASDSIVQFSGFKPTAVGIYTCAIGTTVGGDADLTNNIDTVYFAVTDTLWHENLGDISSSFVLHRQTGGTPLSVMMGTRFDVPTATTTLDTLSGFGVAFASSSILPTAGTISVQLYSADAVATGWTYEGTSKVRALTASDITPASAAPVYAYFAIDQAASGSVTPFILQPGKSYNAIVQIKDINTNLSILASDPPNATGFAGYFGQSDTSLNDGATSFSPSSIATGISAVPLVRMYFGNVPKNTISVQEVSMNSFVGRAFPNPANNTVIVPFTAANNATVSATLTDVLGKVVKSQTINAVGGQATKASFNTADLAAGLYIYNVEVDGQHFTGRVSIAH